MEHRVMQLPFSRADVAAALPDLLARRMGVPVKDPHPIAEALEGPNYRPSLVDLAGHVAGAPTVETHQVRSFAAGDFAGSFGDALTRPVVAAYRETAREHRACLYDIPLRDFRETLFPYIDSGATVSEVPAGGEFPLATLNSQTGVTAQVKSWGALLPIPRPLLVNDEMGVIAQLLGAYGQQLARLEARLLAAVLEANGNLGDGSPLFTGANDTTFGASLALSVLNQMAEVLREQATPSGELANNAPAVLLIPAFLGETTARDLLATVNAGGGPPIQLVVNPWLTTNAVYLMAAPAAAPTLVRLILNGTADPSMGEPYVRQSSAATFPLRSRAALLGYDGVVYRVQHDVNVAAVSRVGIVRSM